MIEATGMIIGIPIGRSGWPLLAGNYRGFLCSFVNGWLVVE